MPEVYASLHLAFDYYVETGDVACAVAIAGYSPHSGVAGRRLGVAEMVARALTLVPPDSHEAGHLLSRQGLALAQELSDYEGAQESFSRALAIARREEDLALEMRTLNDAIHVDHLHLNRPGCLEKGQRAIELAQRLDAPRTEVEVRLEVGSALRGMGVVEEMEGHASAILAAAERAHDRTSLTNAFVCNENLYRLRGDLQTARDFSDRGLAVLATEHRLLSARAVLEYEVGDFTQGAAYLERFLEAMRLSPPGPTAHYAGSALVIPLIARITGKDHRFDVAEAAGKTVVSSPSANLNSAMAARAALGLLAVLRSDAVVAEEQYSALKSQRGTMLPLAVSIAVDRLLGLLSQTIGNHDRAA